MEVETDIGDKLEVARVLIERVEGGASKARVTSIEAADRVLTDWASSAPDAGQEQCDFQIMFEDGLLCRGRYYLERSQKRISLSRYVRKRLSELAAGDTRPALRRSVQAAAISLSGNDPVEAAREVLDHYRI
jgi:hypothetical protein